jgi:hypothetical protein
LRSGNVYKKWGDLSLTAGGRCRGPWPSVGSSRTRSVALNLARNNH